MIDYPSRPTIDNRPAYLQNQVSMIREQIHENKQASENKNISGVFARFLLQDTAGLMLPDERVSWCMKRITPLSDKVEIHKVNGGKRATYKNLQTCGSIWHCPICASRITEQRRIELGRALRYWQGTMVMVTYTLAHNRSMSLVDVLASIKYAYQASKSGKVWNKTRKDYWIAGSVRALEVTYGLNGWHVHIHELMFVDKRDSRGHSVCLSDEQTNGLQGRIFSVWRTSLKRRGKTADAIYGVNVTNAENTAAEYVAKYGREPIESFWDATHELVKSNSKRGRGIHNTPLELLAMFSEGDVKAGNAWMEYARAFKGSKQLVWSTDIRKFLKLEAEKSDQELSETIAPEFLPFAEITRKEWIAIRGLKKRGELLHFASEHTAEETKEFIEELSGMWWGI